MGTFLSKCKGVLWPEARKSERLKERPIQYDGSSHLIVLFQCYGSVWPKVLPFCIVNMIWTSVIEYLRNNNIKDLTFSDSGHTFMSVIVSFLILQRVQVMLSRYFEASALLAKICLSCRELLHFVASTTRKDTSEQARLWRNEVAFRSCLLLRVTCSMLDHKATDSRDVWDVRGDVAEDDAVGVAEDDEEDSLVCEEVGSDDDPIRASRWAGGYRGVLWEENQRYPLRVAYRLRCTLLAHQDRLTKPLDTNRELKLWYFTDGYMEGYQGLRRFINTPYPFPLAQMARTFLLFYVYTLPLALINDISDSSIPYLNLILIFIITYGFVGLEYVAIALDDPFGDDPTDFDHYGRAYMVFEDIFVTIHDVDGMEYAKRLRRRMQHQKLVGSEFKASVAASGAFSTMSEAILGENDTESP